MASPDVTKRLDDARFAYSIASTPEQYAKAGAELTAAEHAMESPSAPCRDCGAPLSLGSERCTDSGAPCRDAYDVAYDYGYADGRRGARKCPPGTDADVNYFDGYADGAFAAYQERF